MLKQCIEARSALTELDTASQLIPNPAVLINTIPLLEARDSSEIENIVTTADKLFRLANANDQQADPATKEALHYRTALANGFKSLASLPLCTRTAIDVCSTLKSSPMEIRKIPGTALTGLRGVVYTPPLGEARLRELLANWEQFVHYEVAMDPLVRLAVSHYQFEAIHPFHDGNGRTGRILNLLLLSQTGLLRLPVLYLSRYILSHKKAYYGLLLDVTRRQASEPWIVFMLKGIEETARWTTARISGINQLQRRTAAYVKRSLPKIYSRDLVDALFVQPYCRIANLVESGVAKRQTAAVYLRDLCTIGVLSELKIGRERVFVHPKFMKLLVDDRPEFVNYHRHNS